MQTLSLLQNPDTYIPCSTENMLVDHDYRNYWLLHFQQHFPVLMQHALDTYGPSAQSRIDACTHDFLSSIQAIRETPDLLGELDILVLDLLRQKKLIAHQLPDPFLKMKQRENETVLALYPTVVAELDAHANPLEALLLATTGIFAGNIFDLGARATAQMFASESPDFLKVRDTVARNRPWLVDHFNPLAQRILTAPHQQAIFLCDNAGSDCLLGVLPFCRFLAQRGTTVLIAANHLPALNDMTFAELSAILPRLQALDPLLDSLVKSGKIAPLNSGGDAPLIDLRRISPQLNAAAQSTDLFILEGMGRALESNYEAHFKIDTLKLAMIKDELVATRHHGKLFDSICRFDPAPLPA